MPTVQENEQKFEEMGLGSVRMLISTSGLPQQMMTDAIHWAARREEEERQRELASKDEQEQLAREQSRLARQQTQLAVEQKQIARRTLSVTWIAAAAAIAALRGDHSRGECDRPVSIGGDRRGSEQPAKERLASADLGAVKSFDSHRARALLGARAQLLGMTTQLSNHIRGVLKTFGMPRRSSDAVAAKRPEWAESSGQICP